MDILGSENLAYFLFFMVVNRSVFEAMSQPVYIHKDNNNKWAIWPWLELMRPLTMGMENGIDQAILTV